MSYFEKIGIYGADSPSVDAFGRWRSATPTTLFDSKFLHSTSSLFWVEKGYTGATSSHNSYSASVYMNVTNVSGSRIVRQTRRRFNYQPGKSQLIVNTGIFGNGVQGVIKRLGYFDSENGLYFVQSGSNFGVGLRTTSTTGAPVDTFYSQSIWNLDPMNGTGPSGEVLDVTKAQIYFCDFEWLGVGRVRYGVYIAGIAHYVHEITHTNVLNTVYMSTPNLPVRYEITNYGTTAPSTLVQICSTVISEGGLDATGVGTSINNGITPLSVAVGSERMLLAIRKDPQFKGTYILPHAINIATPDTNDARWSIWVNPTITESMSWQSINGVNIQYATGSNQTVTGGSLVSSGYIIGGTNQTAGSTVDSSLPHFQGLGFDLDNNPDILVLSIQSIGGTNTYLASWDIQVEK